jgi:hypothetical protein
MLKLCRVKPAQEPWDWISNTTAQRCFSTVIINSCRLGQGGLPVFESRTEAGLRKEQNLLSFTFQTNPPFPCFSR